MSQEVEELTPEQRLVAAEEAMFPEGAEPEAKPEPETKPEPEPEAKPEPEAETEPEAKPEPEPEQTPEQRELSELRQLRKEKDSAFAIMRRREQQLRAQEQELLRRNQDLEERGKKVDDAERFNRMVKENPLSFFEQVAQQANMKPSELLERLQRRYLNHGQPGPDEQVEEFRGVKSEIQALREEFKREKEDIAKQREAQQELERRAKDTQTLEKAVSVEAGRWRYLAAWKKADEVEFKRMLGEAMELVDQTGQTYSAGEVLDFLEEREAKLYDRSKRLDSERGRSPGDEQKTDRGSGSPATARKPAAARTVTNNDAANGSGARREMTPEERLMEADRILRGG